MADPRNTAASLLRLVVDAGASPDEKRTAALRFAEHCAKYDLLGQSAPAASPERTLDALERSLQVNEAIVAKRIADARAEAYDDGRRTGREEGREAGRKEAQRSARGIANRWTEEARAAGYRDGFADGTKDAAERELQAEVAAELAQEEQATRDAIRALFAAEPEQGGADAIARKLHIRAEEVRFCLGRLVTAGEIVATGKARARRHRLAESRPATGTRKAQPRPKSGT